MTVLGDKLKEALKDVKLNISDYGDLPSRELILLFFYPEDMPEDTPDIIKEWEKLNVIRKNLYIVDRYIHENKGETLWQWAKARNERGINNLVLNKIGNHNDKTGGISAYFLNLQNFYDEEEQKYDELEQKLLMPEEITVQVGNMKVDREEKRKIRRKVRKIKIKDLKNDGRGFLVLEEEKPADTKESVKMAAADGKSETTGEIKNTTETKPVTKEEIPQPAKEKLSKAGKITLFIAGTSIVIGIGVAMFNSFASSKE